jgi:NAD(P)-dependent dehydrogenase (short-subunit alcohol dehydrogenase family)
VRFENQVALITGGAIGFGRMFGRALAAEGASVVVADIDLAAAQLEVEALEADGRRAVAVECDVADEDAVGTAVARAAEEFGGIDILINNAAKHLSKYNQPFGALPRFEIRALFDVNVIGIVNCTLACSESMKNRGGGVVLNMSSSAGLTSLTPYGVSKLAVRGLTIAFAKELAPLGVRVNGIAPGLMATENAMADLPQSLVDKWLNELQLVPRQGTMDDIVKTMLFLCSDDASFITGETLRVTGGHPLVL